MRATGFLVAALLVLAAGCSFPAPTSAALPTAPTAGIKAAQTVAAPASITIPKLGVTDTIVPVGLDASGALDVPDVHNVGYYTGMVKPGETGASLLVGHVNFDGVPGALGKIGTLVPGDEVHVADAAGVDRRFVVYDVVSFPKTQYAARIGALLADTVVPELRLVTCSGRVVAHSYLDNTVVSARLLL